jgi:hypothetical protein
VRPGHAVGQYPGYGGDGEVPGVGKLREDSVGRRGDCYDNAVVESFLGSLKTERVHRQQYRTRDQARRDIFAYIELFYNRRRPDGYRDWAISHQPSSRRRPDLLSRVSVRVGTGQSWIAPTRKTQRHLHLTSILVVCQKEIALRCHRNPQMSPAD